MNAIRCSGNVVNLTVNQRSGNNEGTAIVLFNSNIQISNFNISGGNCRNIGSLITMGFSGKFGIMTMVLGNRNILIKYNCNPTEC